MTISSPTTSRKTHHLESSGTRDLLRCRGNSSNREHIVLSEGKIPRVGSPLWTHTTTGGVTDFIFPVHDLGPFHPWAAIGGLPSSHRELPGARWYQSYRFDVFLGGFMGRSETRGASGYSIPRKINTLSCNRILPLGYLENGRIVKGDGITFVIKNGGGEEKFLRPYNKCENGRFTSNIVPEDPRLEDLVYDSFEMFNREVNNSIDINSKEDGESGSHAGTSAICLASQICKPEFTSSHSSLVKTACQVSRLEKSVRLVVLQQSAGMAPHAVPLAGP
ncbi:hypothetical protein LguiB_032002 [Lonicera macranthoides]